MSALLVRRLAAGFTALLAFGSAVAARAQNAPPEIAPLQVATDQNNVNLHDGRTTIEMPVLSVPGAPNLRYDRLHNAAPFLNGKRLTASGAEQVQRTYTIHIGAASSDAFDCVESECTSVSGSGATFNPNLRVYTEHGSATIWSFALPALTDTSPTPSYNYYATAATYANGEVINYYYDSVLIPGAPFQRKMVRPIRITSSLGYLIKLTYPDTNDPTSSDWLRVTAAAIYSAADETTPLRRFAYEGGTITEYGLGDTTGRSYVCDGCVGAMGTSPEVASGSMQMPGETSPSLQVSPLAGNAAVIGAVTRNGVQSIYSYDNLHRQPGTSRYIFDTMTVTGPDESSQVYQVGNSYHSVYDLATNRIHTNITSSSDALNRTTSYSYDSYDRLWRVVYPELNKVSVVYDEYRNIISRTATPRPGSTGLSPITETAHYDVSTCPAVPQTTPLCWRPTWIRDGFQSSDRQTDFSYNAAGQLTEQRDPADANGVRRRTSIVYTVSAGGLSRRTAVRICNDAGAGTTCGTNAPIQTEYDYWQNTLLPSAERRIDVTQGQTATLTTSYTYDAAGRLIATDGPMQGTADTSYNRYDAYGRLAGTISPDPDGAEPLPRHAVRNTYDQTDRLIRVETGTLASLQDENVRPADWTGFTPSRTAETVYDGNGRKIMERVRAGGAAGTIMTRTEYGYDPIGRLECTAVRMNPASFGALPASACDQTTPAGSEPDRITKNVYDAAGQITQVHEGVETADAAIEVQYSYTPNGNVSNVIDGNGNPSHYDYDGLGRRSHLWFPSATALTQISTGDYEQYWYDAAGNRTGLRKRDGSMLTYNYDNRNRVTSKIVPERPSGPQALSGGQTRDVHYGYDLGDRQIFARFDSPTGEGVTNSHDGFGRLLSSSINLGGVTRTLNYDYDANGGRTRITHPDGNWFSYERDGLGRPFYLASADNSARHYTSFRPDGLPAGQSRGNGASTWSSRDGVGRLNGLGHYYIYGGSGPNDVLWLYGHNPAGQIASASRDNDLYAWTNHYPINRTYAANGLNQYTTAGGASFSYDTNGNLTGDVAHAYTYDIENRLVAATGGGAGATLDYDPLGRLWRVTSGSNATTFLYDGDALVVEYNAAGTMTRRYVHGEGADVPVIAYDDQTLAAPRYLHPDHQGSIVALSGASGALSAINRYDEYGIPVMNAQGVNLNTGRFQYTGQIWLPEIGMYYYKARVYSPFIGRFLQTDPIGYQDQFNLYAYVGNDPVNRTDPTGLCSQNTDTGAYVGICAFSNAEGDFVLGLLRQADIADLDIEASNANRLIYVRFGEMTLGSRRADGSWLQRPRRIDGERTEEELEGDRRIFVNIDRTDSMTVFGTDRRTGQPMDHVNTSEENAAHGLGHARDFVRGENHGEDSANDMEGRYRRSHNIDPNFRREGHEGRRAPCTPRTGTRLC